MKMLPITPKQTEIILYLYQFRFLNTYQLQQLLNHKNANGILLWLKDLIHKQYIKRHYNQTSPVEKLKPAVYYLSHQSRFILKTQKDLLDRELEYIYLEHKREKRFIEHCLFIADIYIFMRKQQDTNDEIKFFTTKELQRYKHFPHPLPDAFIAIKNKNTTKRYFLDYFDPYIPPFVIRKRIKQYITNFMESDWQTHTNNTPFPYVLFVCPNNKIKNHIKLYGKTILEESFTQDIFLYVTISETFKHNNIPVWEKI